MRVGFELTRFDSPIVLRYMDQKEARAMNRLGATGVMIARRSIRKQTKAVLTGKAKPKKGQPPRWRRRGQATLKDGIFYGWDPLRHQLFMGPILTSNRRQDGQTVPQWLENNGFSFMRPMLETLHRRGLLLLELARN